MTSVNFVNDFIPVIQNNNFQCSGTDIDPDTTNSIWFHIKTIIINLYDNLN